VLSTLLIVAFSIQNLYMLQVGACGRQSCRGSDLLCGRLANMNRATRPQGLQLREAFL